MHLVKIVVYSTCSLVIVYFKHFFDNLDNTTINPVVNLHINVDDNNAMAVQSNDEELVGQTVGTQVFL